MSSEKRWFGVSWEYYLETQDETKGLVESNWKRLGQGKVRKKGRVIGVG